MDRMLSRSGKDFTMGGGNIHDNWDLTASSTSVTTLVLVGQTGNGKSATGNSILDRKAFKSRASLSRVTSTCELQRTVLKDGRTVNVIDTPGLFDFSAEDDFVVKEIVKCIDLAEEEIHAVLVVFSTRGGFSRKEEAFLQTLRTFFGEKINDYMILVFTGRDDLEENDETLEDYICRECPETLQRSLDMCDNRVVLFDNKTKDVRKRAQQVSHLLSLVDKVEKKNNGQPYSDEFSAELKRGVSRLNDKRKKVADKPYDDQLKQIIKMVETKLRDIAKRLEQQLAEDHAARLKAEEIAEAAQMRSNDEICKLRESLERAQRERETEDQRRTDESKNCAIL